MPPHVEVDASHHDEWHLERPPRLALSNDEPSPLFLDYDAPSPGSSSLSLSRRQSDPDFSKYQTDQEVVLKDDPAKKAAAAPVVSVITAIIGPESAYVRNSSESGSTAASSTATAASVPRQRAPQRTAAQQKKPASQNKNSGKADKSGKPMHVRVTHYVSKKGWKVVKSLPRKVASTVKGAKVPGHHRNVV